MNSGCCCVCALLALATTALPADDGYELWLRYRRVANTARLGEYRSAIGALLLSGDSPTQRRDARGTGCRIARPAGRVGPGRAQRDAQRHADRRNTGQSGMAGWRCSRPRTRLRRAGDEGFVLRATTRPGEARQSCCAANRDIGVMYGAFHLLRLLETQASRCASSVSAPGIQAPAARPLGQSRPHRRARLRRASRCGTGRTLPDSLPAALSRLRARQRVDRHQRHGAHEREREREGAHAGVSHEGRGARRRVSSVRHQRVPHGAIQRADRDRRAEDGRSARSRGARVVEGEGRRDLPAHVPDFGGFLVKANSEGQPGPQDYKRTHADGANMLADAVAPHGGIVMWRAFVYSNDVPVDRVQAGVRRVQAARRHIPRRTCSCR